MDEPLEIEQEGVGAPAWAAFGDLMAGVLGAFVLVLAPLAQLLPGSTGDHIHAYLPTEAGHLIGQAHRADGDLLGPWQGFGVFCLWTAVLLVIAGYLLRRRDA